MNNVKKFRQELNKIAKEVRDTGRSIPISITPSAEARVLRYLANKIDTLVSTQ